MQCIPCQKRLFVACDGYQCGLLALRPGSCRAVALLKEPCGPGRRIGEEVDEAGNICRCGPAYPPSWPRIQQSAPDRLLLPRYAKPRERCHCIPSNHSHRRTRGGGGIRQTATHARTPSRAADGRSSPADHADRSDESSNARNGPRAPSFGNIKPLSLEQIEKKRRFGGSRSAAARSQCGPRPTMRQ